MSTKQRKKRVQKRKPAEVEMIYDSITGATKIGTHAKINEILTVFYADFIGVKCDEDFYRHPELVDFYTAQWPDISNAIRRYGGRTVIQVLSGNKWVCDPRYHRGHPLRTKKLVAQMKTLAQQQKQAVPASVEPETPMTHETQRYINPKLFRDF